MATPTAAATTPAATSPAATSPAATPTAPAAYLNGAAGPSPYPSISALHPTGTATVAPDPNPTTIFDRPRFDQSSTRTAVRPDVVDPDDAMGHAESETDGEPVATGAVHRHHRLVWVGLVVFWLLGLGAGLVTLTSLGARASCTGSDKSLDCGNTGSAIALVLTLCVIVLVGVVTVHALDVRDRVRSWLLDLSLGVLVLLALSFAAWRLISTING